MSLCGKDLSHDGLPVHVCHRLCGILHVSRVTFEHVQVRLQSPSIIFGPGISPGSTLCRLRWRARLLCWPRWRASAASPVVLAEAFLPNAPLHRVWCFCRNCRIHAISCTSARSTSRVQSLRVAQTEQFIVGVSHNARRMNACRRAMLVQRSRKRIDA